ncbi:PREDICTED: uncharacterized protein LOC104732638 [Camelina sativa]|uniref:Uncharacterized protein LOC104732638 n=1 Tax=Camelina sativa TaxID=90675 RepID=A0ABM0V467_CAMSA|nr:PREDICTED: uncharacterized protein LOC104732638 [Camelina sativa]XP_010450503.1 PREDICTED: uncharacterized protein LOC104732638 [Camelina sativa]XP_010450504.1 PREDICTED: uncharacterized protein LOC104732638 [Camelina sativa]XP_010450505.1 PREDICTED: uncharacterized protein LOC104732638 [Camelina sativa]
MADNTSSEASPSQPPLFLEVFCEVSGKEYRFTNGTKAKFAVSVINRKLGSLKPRVVFIEAAREGEEPISFGDDASLVSYGDGWKLKTVVDSDFPGTERYNLPQHFPSVISMGSKDPKYSKPEIGEQSLKYIGRIFFAFVLMFILGGLFTVALENLPRLILLFKSSPM